MIWHYITITDREYDMQMKDDKYLLVHVYYIYNMKSHKKIISKKKEKEILDGPAGIVYHNIISSS